MTKENLITFKIRFLMIGLFCLTISSLAQSSVTLEGIIESHVTDEDGAPVKVALSVEEIDEEGDTVNRNLIIENNKKGKELLARVGEAVQIKGTVKRDKAGNNMLTVLEYTVSADESDEAEEDSEDYE